MGAWVSRVASSLDQLASTEELSLDEVQAHICRDYRKCEDQPMTAGTRAQTDRPDFTGPSLFP